MKLIGHYLETKIDMLPEITHRKPIIITAARTPSLNRVMFRALQHRNTDPDTPWQTMVESKRSKCIEEAIKLAQKILRQPGKYKWVKQCEEGYRIGGVQAEILGCNYYDEKLRDTARLTLLYDMLRLGYRAAVMVMDPAKYELLAPSIIDEIRAVGVREDDFILMSRDDLQPDTIGLSFPRDLFTQVDDTIYINPAAVAYDWRSVFHWANGVLTNEISPIGFGGEVIIGEKFAFLSEKAVPDPSCFPISERLWARKQVRLCSMKTIATERKLTRMGRKVYRIPPSWIDIFPPELLKELGTNRRFMMLSDHADLNLLHLPKENGVFIAEPYYRENRELLDRIMDEINPDIFRTIIEEDGLPINSLPLPNGGVYLDAAAVTATGILRDAGIRVETTSRPFGTWAWGAQAGIHCATNTVWL